MDLLRLALLPLLWVVTALPSAKAGAPDFAKGFDLLFELGLPDASNPDWRYTPLSGPSLQRQDFIDPFGSFNVRIGLGDVFEHGWVQTTPSNAVATPPGTAASTPIPEPHFPTGTKVLMMAGSSKPPFHPGRNQSTWKS
jgi:hypothetical protein